MVRLLNLIHNELIKIFARKKIYVFMVIILFFNGIFGVSSLMAKRNMPAQIANDVVNFNGQVFPVTSLDGLSTILAIFLIILIADMLTEEYIGGTLKLPLLRPVTRGQLLAGKTLALFLVTVLLFLFTMLSGYLIGILSLGWGNKFVMAHTTLSSLKGILTTLMVYGLTLLPIFAFGVAVLALSLFLTSSGSVIGLAIGMLFAGSIISQVSRTLSPFIITTYFKPYHDLINGNWAAINAGLLAFVVYTAVFYLASHWYFTRKNLLY